EALVVCTVRDLPCSFEPDLPVRGSRPDPRLRLAPALVSRPLCQATFSIAEQPDALRAPYQLFSVDNFAKSLSTRATVPVAFLVTVVDKLRLRCVAVSRRHVRLRGCPVDVRKEDRSTSCRH